MKKIILLGCIALLLSCYSENYHEVFDELENKDFSFLKNTSITNRWPTYLIYNANIEKDSNIIYVRKNIWGKIYEIENFNDEPLFKTIEETESLENLIKKFDELNVTYASLDSLGNIEYGFFFKNCFYKFLRLSSDSSLEKLKMTYFKKYKNNWYIDVACGEYGIK